MTATTVRGRAALALVFNAFVWGVSWWPFRQLQERGLHPLWTTAFVYAMAVGVITLVRPVSWRELLRTPALWVILIGSGCTNAGFNWAVTTGDVVRAVLLFYLMPLWAVVLARLLLHEALHAAALVRVAMALSGALIVLKPPGGGWPLPQTLADALAIAGGFSFALNNVMLRREAHRAEGARALAMFLGGVLVAGTMAASLGPSHGVPWPGQPTAWLLPGFALGAVFLLSNLALQYGASRLPAQVTSVVMLTEVVFASVSALALGGGELSARVLAGGSLIVGAALLAAWTGR
jgi:drug/metabolite transporter (DMT)-like permease